MVVEEYICNIYYSPMKDLRQLCYTYFINFAGSGYIMFKPNILCKIMVLALSLAVLFCLFPASSSALGKADNPGIKGAVIKPAENTYVKNCVIDIKKDGKWLGNMRTDNLGRFEIKNPEDGLYELEAIPDRYSKDLVYSKYAVSEVFKVEIKDGKYSGSPIVLNLRMPQISGTVMDTDCHYPGDWTCLVRITNKQTDWQMEDPVYINGEFRTAGLSDGKYSIYALYYAEDKKYSPSLPVDFQIKDGKYDGSHIYLKLTAAK